MIEISVYLLYRLLYQSPIYITISGGAVAIVVVVCVGLLLVLLIVGVLRLRGPTNRRYRKANDGTGDLQWDDSGMNIIVNPLEVSTVYNMVWNTVDAYRHDVALLLQYTPRLLSHGFVFHSVFRIPGSRC